MRCSLSVHVPEKLAEIDFVRRTVTDQMGVGDEHHSTGVGTEPGAVQLALAGDKCSE